MQQLAPTSPPLLANVYLDFKQALVEIEAVEKHVERRIDAKTGSSCVSRACVPPVSTLIDVVVHLDRRISELETQLQELGQAQAVVAGVRCETRRKALAVLTLLDSQHIVIHDAKSDLEQLYSIAYDEGPAHHNAENALLPFDGSQCPRDFPLPSILRQKWMPQSDLSDNRRKPDNHLYQRPSLPPCTPQPNTAREPYVYSPLGHYYRSPRPVTSINGRSYQQNSLVGRSRSASVCESAPVKRCDWVPAVDSVSGSFTSRPITSYDYQRNGANSEFGLRFHSPNSYRGTPLEDDSNPSQNFICPEAFESVPQLLRRRVKLEEVNDLYQYLRRLHSKATLKRNHRDLDQWITPKMLSEAGFVVTGRKGEEKLLILRHLGLIELSRENHLRIKRNRLRRGHA